MDVDSPPQGACSASLSRSVSASDFINFYDPSDHSLPRSFDGSLQPVASEIGGLGVARLAKFLGRIRISTDAALLDWQVNDDRVPTPGLHLQICSKLLVRCIGSAPWRCVCTRCLERPEACAVASCRAAASWLDGENNGEVVGLGAGMCCLFSDCGKLE